MALPGSAAIPATHAERLRLAEATGRRGRDRARARRARAIMLTDGLPQRHGGAAGDRRLDQRDRASCGDRRPRRASVDLDEFDRLAEQVPVLIDLKPSGDHYMEHFHQRAGCRA